MYNMTFQSNRPERLTRFFSLKPWQFTHRVDLHNGLKRLAVDTSGKGTPVIINLNSRVTSVDPETGTITLENGKTYHGDVVIGADGVRVSPSCPP